MKGVETQNYRVMAELASNLVYAKNSDERMGLIYGRFGLGKTFGLEQLAFDGQAVYVTANPAWTMNMALTELITQLDHTLKGKEVRMRKSSLLFNIESMLRNSNKLVIVDEIEWLLGHAGTPAKLDILHQFKAIHDKCRNPWLFVGDETVNRKVQNYKAFNSRIMQRAEFGDFLVQDIKRFCGWFLSEKYGCPVVLGDDLMESLAALGSFRLVAVELLWVYQEYKKNPMDSMDLRSYKMIKKRQG